MEDGTSPETAIGIPPPQLGASELGAQEPQESQNFTPLPESIIAGEAPKDQMSTAAAKALIEQIVGPQGNERNPETPQVSESSSPTEKKPQGFIGKIIEWIKNFFRGLFFRY